MFHDLPYSVEYAKSCRSTCHSCEQPIGASSLRLAIITQVPSMDERTKCWFHYDCFFARAQPAGPDAIDAFEYLKFEDQTRIVQSIAEIKMEKHSKQRFKRKVPIEDLIDPIKLEEAIPPKQRKSDIKRLNEINADLSNISKGQIDSKKPTGSQSTIKSSFIMPNLKKEEEKDLLQNQSDVLFRNIDETKRMGSFKKFPSDHWIHKIGLISTDAFQVRYHIADVLTFGLLEGCVTCGGMLYYKLGRYCCTMSTCSFNVESPARHFPDEELENDPLLDGCHFERCYESRAPDPVLRQCFELRVKQAMDFLDSNDSQTESQIEPFENDKPIPNFFIRDSTILEPYNALLVKVNILDNKNSYTRIQLLQDAQKKKLWLVRAYGRIGTTFRGRRVKYFTNQREAIKKFESLYESQTKNKWTQRQLSTKQPNSYFHLDLDCVNPEVGLYLPFGKPTKEQLAKAHSTLVEIEHVSSVTFDNLVQFAELWNKFYMYFPQCFGIERPALITDREKIVQKKNIIELLIRG